MMQKTALITGTAGFIGFHLAKRMLAEGWRVVGYDNVNDYYDVNLKNARTEILRGFSGFTFIKAGLEDQQAMDNVFIENRFDVVVNLAAQAGVRYSLEQPRSYITSNIVGFMNILENCRHHKIGHLVYASSSSVYGRSRRYPFSTSHNVDHPLSLYAATKKADELMAHTYANLYGLPVTGLRFFTVYGPWGRPDMALFLFTRAILAGRPIDVYNNGDMSRDFTYIDDIVEGIYRLIVKGPAKPDENWDAQNPDPATSFCPYRIFNIGNNSPVRLEDFIKAVESATGMQAKRNYMPMQPGDVPVTYADVTDLFDYTGFRPGTDIRQGVKAFVDWYREYYKV